jgi:hypothetical protein
VIVELPPLTLAFVTVSVTLSAATWAEPAGATAVRAPMVTVGSEVPPLSPQPDSSAPVNATRPIRRSRKGRTSWFRIGCILLPTKTGFSMVLKRVGFRPNLKKAKRSRQFQTPTERSRVNEARAARMWHGALRNGVSTVVADRRRPQKTKFEGWGVHHHSRTDVHLGRCAPADRVLIC